MEVAVLGTKWAASAVESRWVKVSTEKNGAICIGEFGIATSLDVAGVVELLGIRLDIGIEDRIAWVELVNAVVELFAREATTTEAWK